VRKFSVMPAQAGIQYAARFVSNPSIGVYWIIRLRG